MPPRLTRQAVRPPVQSISVIGKRLASRSFTNQRGGTDGHTAGRDILGDDRVGADDTAPPEGQPEGGWYPEQCLTREEVLNGYLAEGAYAGFEEDIKGTIAPGMLADFIVISDDIRTIPPAALLNLEVEQTYVGGRLVYDGR